MSIFEGKVNKSLTATLGAVVAAALSISASPNWGLALLIFSLMMAVGSLFVVMDRRFEDVSARHERCELRTQAILKAMFRNGHRGKKRRQVDVVFEQILRGETVGP